MAKKKTNKKKNTHAVNFLIVFFEKVSLFCIICLSLDLISVLAKWTKQQYSHASYHQVPHIIGLLDSQPEIEHRDLIWFAVLFLSLSLSLLSLVPPLLFLNQSTLSPLIALALASYPSPSLSCSDLLSVYRPVSLASGRYRQRQDSEVIFQV